MLKENIGEEENQEIDEQKMENNNTTELLKINYTDYFHKEKDNEATENDGVVTEDLDENGTQVLDGGDGGSLLSIGVGEVGGDATIEGQDQDEEKRTFFIIEEPPQQQSTPTTIVPEKRGRGRPRKYPKISSSSVQQVKCEKVEKPEYSMMKDENVDVGNQTAPPIVLKLKLGTSEDSEEKWTLNSTVPAPALPLKRGRGRPRKTQQHNSTSTLIEHDNLPVPNNSSDASETKNQNDHLKTNESANIPEVKTRLRGRPKTMNYLHIQRMWTPKTAKECLKKRRRNVIIAKAGRGRPRIQNILSLNPVKGVRGRPRIHPLPDPSLQSFKNTNGKPSLSYGPEHIKMLLEKNASKKSADLKKHSFGGRGRPTKIEALRLMLEDRKDKVTDSNTSTKCTTPNQESPDEDIETTQNHVPLTFSFDAALEEIQDVESSGSIENKENLLYVKSKALCDNRKLRVKLLARNDPVFRDMKMKFEQELKNIHKFNLMKSKQPVLQQSSHRGIIRRRGPRGPYKKTLFDHTANSHKLCKRNTPSTSSSEFSMDEKRIRKKIVPRKLNKCTDIELISEPHEPPPIEYPSDLESFMRANNLTSNRESPKILISRSPFNKPVSKNIIVKKNPFINIATENVVKRKRGRPRKSETVVKPPLLRNQPPSSPAIQQTNGFHLGECINLISSDEEEEQDSSSMMNCSYPMVTNEPINYEDEDEEAFFSLYPNNNISISLISDDEDDQ